MKRILLLVLAFTAAIGSLSAQNYIVVNSEKVFKSIDEYNKALDTLDQLAKSYQQQVDLKFEEVEALYNNYKAQEMSLSASSRQARQNLILTREEEASKFQEEIFGQDGTLMKKRIELIQPIQKRVFDAIANYAAQNGYDWFSMRLRTPRCFTIQKKSTTLRPHRIYEKVRNIESNQ